MTKTPQKINKQKIQEMINLNPDARRYFFAKADDRWIDWFWTNGFLDEIKKPAEDVTRYGFTTPEITYLAKVAETVPEKVVQIMLDPDTATTKDKFKPELIDQFLRISGGLKADQLALIIPKIHKQEWVKTMGNFNHWGFEYEKIFKTLASVGDYDNLLLLAETVLVVRTKEEIAKTSNGYGTDNPFYFRDLDQTGVFEFLAQTPDDYLEKALGLVTKIIALIARLGDENTEKNRVFPINEAFYLFDVDFFTLEIGQKEHLSYRDDVRELAAVIKVLVTRLLESKCADHPEAQRLYDNYIDNLPDTRAMWRLRLYTLSLCPEALKVKLKSAYSRLFDVENYYEITGGTEYEKAIQKGFGVLTNDEQREYVKKVFSYFSGHEEDDKRFYTREASCILSMIHTHLTDEEKTRAQKFGFTIKPDYEPQPSVGMSMAGTVVSQGPISQEDFGKLTIEQIATNLRNEWSPQALRDKYHQTDDFLRPHNAEGAGELLKIDIPKRMQEYIDNAEKFFERDVLEMHYTYAFFRGIEDTIKNNRALAQDINWDGLVKMLVAIQKSGESKPFEEKDERSFDSWLAGWNSVHSALTDVVQQLLLESNERTVIDFKKHRDSIFGVISYLLAYPQPTPERETPEDAIISTTSNNGERLVSDPFSIAINTVRGRAFQSLVYFIYPDGRELPEGARIKQDVKDLYERVLEKENTRALMFMFGHYLPQFYFREIDWLKGLIPKIFPEDREKSHLFLASLEGYLSVDLYKQLFDDPEIQKLYYRGLEIAGIKESNRQYFRDPDEGMATHIALAFVHYRSDFGFEHPLFKEFWAKNNPKQHSEFVSFLGRGVISRDGSADFFAKEPEAVERLKEAWDWILKNRTESDIFEQFGFWVKTEVFESKWLAQHIRESLERTKGILNWDYGLTKSAIQLSDEAPEEMLRVAELVLLEGGIKVDNQRRMFYIEHEWTEVLERLYKNPITKQGAESLINILVRDGGNPFWGLKSILSLSVGN